MNILSVKITNMKLPVFEVMSDNIHVVALHTQLKIMRRYRPLSYVAYLLIYNT
jgi:hypothetical protein